jgi:hypothetical protein
LKTGAFQRFSAAGNIGRNPPGLWKAYGSL